MEIIEDSKERANSYNTGMASEYLILYKLYRLGLDAYMSLGNKKSVDIIIHKEENTLTIDVKSVRDYSSIPVNNVKPKKNHFIIAVVYNQKFENIEIEPDIYIIPSFEIDEIKKSWGEQHRLMKTSLEKYKNKWDYLK